MKPSIAIAIFLASSLSSGAAAFTESLSGKLVKLDPTSGEVRPYQIPEDAEIEYFMIYFSAHWCAPCRKMTPALVEFYNETRKNHPEFEFILVSNDRDLGAMHDYLQWAQMPWPAIAWDQREAVAEIVELQPRGIPFMAMVDKEGRLHGASEMGGFSVGIPKLINGLQEKLGAEVYDVRERHGKRSRLVPAIYAITAVLLLIYIIRKRRA